MMDRDYSLALTSMGIGFMGILFAAIEKIMYDNGTLIDEFITGSIVIEDLMAATIILFLLVAVIVAVIKR